MRYWLVWTFFAELSPVLQNICQPITLGTLVIWLLYRARLAWGLQLFLVVIFQNAILLFCIILPENLLVIVISLRWYHHVKAFVYSSFLIDCRWIICCILIKYMLLWVIEISLVNTRSTFALPSYFPYIWLIILRVDIRCLVLWIKIITDLALYFDIICILCNRFNSRLGKRIVCVNFLNVWIESRGRLIALVVDFKKTWDCLNMCEAAL